MAEISNRNMELMTDDILELKKCGLFTDDEINIFTKKLTQLLFRLSKSTTQLQDFRDSIKFLKLLLDEVRQRTREKQSIKTGRLKIMIIQRLQYYYEHALRKFSSNLNFCLEYLDFLSNHSSLDNEGAKHVSQMIERFNSQPKVFEEAAAWFKQKDCHGEAVKVLLKGIGTHPNEQLLYLDLIDLELSNPQDIKIAKFKKYLDSILKNIPDCSEMLIYVLTLLETHPNLCPVQDYILDLLLQKYSNEERVWHTIATMELKGHYYNASPEEMQKKSTNYSIQRCIARYKEGIAKISTKKKPALWKLYLNTLIQLQKGNPNVANVLKVMLKCLIIKR